MKNKVISKIEDIRNIIKKCDCCNLAMVDQNNHPYVIPMNFGFDDEYIYLHSSSKGKKMTILENNKNVCLSFSTDHELRWQSEQVACSYSMKYRSVLVYGTVEFVESPEKKIAALDKIMGQYTEKKFTYSDPAVRDVRVFKVHIDKLEGREYGY